MVGNIEGGETIVMGGTPNGVNWSYNHAGTAQISRKYLPYPDELFTIFISPPTVKFNMRGYKIL